MSFSVGLPQTVCSSVCEFIALEIHDSNFCESLPCAQQPHSTQAQVRVGFDACASEPGRRFVTEQGITKKKKKKENQNLNPGLTTQVNMQISRTRKNAWTDQSV